MSDVTGSRLASEREPSRPDLGPMSLFEFVALVAMLISVVALSLDAMLPSLPDIGKDLGVATANDRQLVISTFILGLSLSPIAFGFAADAYGRKPMILLGLSVFAAGCVLSMLATTFEHMLLGRFLQGLGAAGPRTLAVSVVRDRFEGSAMAQVMSFVMMAFIFTPGVAPALGLIVETVAGWRGMFVFLLCLSGLIAIWMGLRLPETMPAPARRPLSITRIVGDLRLILSSRSACFCALASGFVFAAVLAYLSAAEQLLAEAYGLGDAFVAVFGLLTFVIGAAGYVNAKVVRRIGPDRLSSGAVVFATLWSAVFAIWFGVSSAGGLPAFLLWAVPCFFCVGILFGNLNAMAMRSLGSVAGIGAAVVGSIANFVSFPIGVVIARGYAGDATPIVAGFVICGILAGLSLLIAGTGKDTGRPD